MPAGVEPEGSRNPEYAQILSARALVEGQPQWTSQDIATANSTGAGSVSHAPEYRFFSSSLALALVEPYPGISGSLASPPLSPPVPGETEAKREQENTLYVRDDEPLQPEGSEQKDYEEAAINGEKMHNAGFIALVTKLDEPGPEFGAIGDEIAPGIAALGATPDLDHVVVVSMKAAPGLYEWTGSGVDTLEAVSLLPAGNTVIPTPAAELGGLKVEEKGQANGGDRHAISDDGARVFWTRTTKEAGEVGQHLYVRDTQLRQTLELSAPGEAEAVFQTANAEGTKVYFTDSQRLTPDSGAAEDSPNLYVAEVGIVDGKLTKNVTDLTPEADPRLLVPGSGAVVVAASEEEGESGSYVYFVADGALTRDATPGRCGTIAVAVRPAGTTCNLYVRHYDTADREWEPTRLVAALSAEDLPDWSRDEVYLDSLTSRASPNGRYLAFMSDRSLTGYDNEDASGHGRLDEEVFLYDAKMGTIVCASCNPSGARPTGVFDTTSVEDGEGVRLVVDRIGTWSERSDLGLGSGYPDDWLAASVPGYDPVEAGESPYQSRYLSNSGRLFFNSADALL
ncbi:MAG: hypothetical protein ACREHV_18025, partial [Rhizomicrobium sp.]